MRSFETDDRQANLEYRPVRVPIGAADVFARARELCDDMGWRLVQADPGAGTLCYQRSGGWFYGTATIVVRIEGPVGIPSSTTHVSSTTNGGFLPRDRRNVAEFVRKFTMRVS